MDDFSKQREKPLVLVADDDQSMVELYAYALENADFEVATARDGREAVTRFFELVPDMAILDVLMPNLNGFEACRAIRQSQNGQSTPIVMITGMDDTASVEEAYRAGATNFTTKPVIWAQFAHQMRYIWRACCAQQEAQQYRKRVNDLQAQLEQLSRASGEQELINPTSLKYLIPKIKEIKAYSEILMSAVKTYNEEEIIKKAANIAKGSEDILKFVEDMRDNYNIK